jgi:hypothetical protein
LSSAEREAPPGKGKPVASKDETMMLRTRKWLIRLIALFALGAVGLSAAASHAQTGQYPPDWRDRPERRQNGWEVITAEADSPLAARFVEPAPAQSVQPPAEALAAGLPMFQPDCWFDSQVAVVAAEADSPLTVRFVEPELAPGAAAIAPPPALFQPGRWNDGQAAEERRIPEKRIPEPPQAAAPLVAPMAQPVLQTARQESVAPPRGEPAREVIPVPPSELELLAAPIVSLSTDIRTKENPNVTNDFPRSEAQGYLGRLRQMSYVMNRPGSAGLLCYAWDAPLTNNNPLYFEETNLERHGYSPRYLRAFQPIVSGAEFFATIPTLPYQLTALPPSECIYTLGEYRPGSCVPYQINYPPWSTAGGIVEAGTAVGLAFLIP